MEENILSKIINNVSYLLTETEKLLTEDLDNKLEKIKTILEMKEDING